LDRLLGALGASQWEDETKLIERVTKTVNGFPQHLTFIGQINRALVRLCDSLNESTSDEIKGYARAGLRYLDQATPTGGSRLDELQAQAHAYILHLILHKIDSALGIESRPPSLSLSPKDRAQAETLFRQYQDAPIAQDSVLLARAESLHHKPSHITNTPTFRQLVRNAEYLCHTVSDDTSKTEHKQIARAALSYLFTENDTINERLDAIGYLDDCHILELAISIIDPARRGWLDLIDALHATRELLSQFSFCREGQAPVPVSHFILRNAALTSEPYRSNDPHMTGALFVPATGSTPLLLAFVSSLAALRGSTTIPIPVNASAQQLIAWMVRARSNASQQVILVAPTAATVNSANALLWGDCSLVDLLPMAIINANGSTTPIIKVNLEPVLLIASDIQRASAYIQAQHSLVATTIIDIYASTDTRVVGRAPNKTQLKRRTTKTKEYDPLGGARKKALLTEDEETALSKRLAAARGDMVEALVEMGPDLHPLLPTFAHTESVIAPLKLLQTKLTKYENTREERAPTAEILTKLKETFWDIKLTDDVCDTLVSILMTTRRESQYNQRILEGARCYRAARKEVDTVISTLTEANLRLVVALSKHHQGKGVPFLDLIQEGNLGLIHAAKRFDHTSGARFATYARWWIRQFIDTTVSQNHRAVRVPSHIITKIRQLSRLRTALQQTLNREPTNQEIADAAEMPLVNLQRLLATAQEISSPTSLDQPLTAETEATVGDMLTNPMEQLPEEDVSKRELAKAARELLATLPDTEANVLTLRFGLSGAPPLTLAQIGRQVGLTRERIRQIELKALGRLRFRADKAGGLN
jgi:RNA polymerase sigma factor (sigma-70 family)